MASTYLASRNPIFCGVPSSASFLKENSFDSSSKQAGDNHGRYYGTMGTPSIEDSTDDSLLDDDDSGLYLFWTDQLLREKGYRPASHRCSEENGEDTDESDLSSDEAEDQRESMLSIFSPSTRGVASSSSQFSVPRQTPEPQPVSHSLSRFFSGWFSCWSS